MSSESLNTYGFWTKTDGIDTTDFLKNPVGYYNHESENLPPLRWESLRIEGGQLIGTAVFDEKDEFAMQLWQKVENGFINGASIGFRVIEFSDAPELLKQGQKNATVTRCKLMECSVVNNPANSEALAIRLYAPESDVVLSATKINNVVPKLLQTNMFEKLTALGYKDEEAVIGELRGLKGERDSLKAKLADIEAKQKQANNAQIKALCEKKGLDAQETAAFVKLADADFESTIIVLQARQDYTPISVQIAGQTQQREQTSLLAQLAAHPSRDYDGWASAENGSKFLKELSEKHPEKYEELYKKTYAK